MQVLDVATERDRSMLRAAAGQIGSPVDWAEEALRPFDWAITLRVPGPSAVYSAIFDSRWGQMAFARVLPAYLFGLVVVAKAWGLGERVLAGPQGLSPLAFSAYVLEQGVSIVFMALLAALFVIRRPTVGRRSTLLGAAVALTGTFILNVAGTARVAEDQTAVLFLTSVLVLGGTGIAIAGLTALGRCFGIMPEARGLVTHGLYRWVRHPVYLGEMVAGLGMVVAAGSPTVIALFVVFCGFQFWRTVFEEGALVAAFPEYARYRLRTYRLVPGLY